MLVSLIELGYIDMCAYGVLNELGDCIVQYVVKYGVIFDMPDLRRVSRDSALGGSMYGRVTLSQHTCHVLY